MEREDALSLEERDGAEEPTTLPLAGEEPTTLPIFLVVALSHTVSKEVTRSTPN